MGAYTFGGRSDGVIKVRRGAPAVIDQCPQNRRFWEPSSEWGRAQRNEIRCAELQLRWLDRSVRSTLDRVERGAAPPIATIAGIPTMTANRQKIDLGFTHRATARGDVCISRHGREVVTLRAKAAAAFLARADGAPPEATQQLCARVTGNYKRCNESGASVSRDRKRAGAA